MPYQLRTVGYLALLLAALGIPAQQNERADVALQAAIHKETVEGEPEQAIRQLKEILAKYSGNRAVVAKAWLHLGQCHERLGQIEARKAYEKVASEFADYADVAAQARARLTQMAAAKAAASAGEITVRRVWHGPEVGFWGKVSPDGRFLSYEDQDTDDLAIRDLQTGAGRRLGTSPAKADAESVDYSAWSPDGKQVAYGWWRADDTEELRVASLETGRFRTVLHYRKGWADVHEWSPDGEHILVSTGEEGTCRIALVAVSDGSSRTLKDGKRCPWENLAFSPDGRWIAFDHRQQKDSEAFDISLLSLEDKREVRVVESPANDRLMGWDPHSNTILFTSDRRGTDALWMVRVGSAGPQGAPQFVRAETGIHRPLGITPGGAFYYFRPREDWDAYTVGFDPVSGKILASPAKLTTRLDAGGTFPAYSPDGKYLAYISLERPGMGGRDRPVVIRSLASGEERRISTGLYPAVNLRWSSDGRFLFALGSLGVDGQRGIFRFNAQTGERSPRIAGLPGWSQGSHDPSPDPDMLLLLQPAPDGSREIVAHNLKTGAKKTIHRTGNTENLTLSASPDGRWVAFLNWGPKKVLRVIPAAGGEPREIWRFQDLSMNLLSMDWSPDSRHLYVFRVTARDFQCSLWRVALDSGKAEDLGVVAQSPQGLSVHPNGRQIAFSSGQWHREVWVLENFLAKPAPQR